MSTLNFDEEYRKLSLDSIGPINNLSNRVRKNIKFAMLKNIWPMQTIVKFKMHPDRDEINQKNYKYLKEYLRKNSSFASFWLEKWPKKEVYLNFLNFDKFKEGLTQNLPTRAIFEDNEQLFVFGRW